MKEKPTTFQLAQLAAQASTPVTLPKDAVRRAMALWGEAEAEIAEHDNRAEFLRNLFWAPNKKDVPIFTDTPEEWSERIKAYPGDERDVERALWEERFPNEEVQKQLFKDKTLGRDTRRTLFLGLARASIRFEVQGPPVPHAGRLEYLEGGGFTEPEPGFPIHPKNLELAKLNHQGAGEMLVPATEVRFVKQAEAMLSRPKLYGYLVRWAVEVRQKQLAVARTRDIPESVRTQRDDGDGEANIQFKPKYR
jgi:hypothetical protein